MVRSENSLTERVVFRLTPKELKLLDTFANHSRMEMSEAIRYIIRGWFVLTTRTLIEVIKTMPELIDEQDKWLDEITNIMSNRDEPTDDGDSDES